MYAESVTIEIPEWLSSVQPLAAQVPTWAWVAISVVTWYSIAGFVVRKCSRDEDEQHQLISLWIVSPIVFPLVIAFIAMLWTFFYLLTPVLWVVSGGLVKPFWKWKNKPF